MSVELNEHETQMLACPEHQSEQLKRLLEATKDHVMTKEEIQAQRESWVRGMTGTCEHGEADFEQCGECRK